MPESWIQQLLRQTGLLGGLVGALSVQWLAVSCRLRSVRKNILMALCMAVMGFILVGISFMSFAVLLVSAWWLEYPLHALGGLTLLYLLIGFVLIQKAIRRMI